MVRWFILKTNQQTNIIASSEVGNKQGIFILESDSSLMHLRSLLYEQMILESIIRIFILLPEKVQQMQASSYFGICLVALLFQTFSLTCEIQGHPLKTTNGQSIQPYFYFLSDQKPLCHSVNVNVSFAFKGPQCTYNRKVIFSCSSKMDHWDVLLYCDQYFTGNNQNKTINIQGTIIFLQTNQTCTVQGTTNIEFYDPFPDTDPGTPTWPIIVGVTAGVIVIGGIAAFFIRRHLKKKKSQSAYSQMQSQS